MEKKDFEDALKIHADELKIKQEELKTAIEKKADVSEIEALKVDLLAKQAQLDDISTKLAKAEKAPIDDEPVTLEKALKELMASPEFKAAKERGFVGGKDGKANTFELKVDTSNITGIINRTVQNLTVKFAPENTLAFLPKLATGFIGQDKSYVLWVDGAYSTNVGYVAEGNGQGTADTATATERTRQMAKISAKLSLSGELLEDAEYIASALRMKLSEKALLFADTEAYSGDGATGAPTHIWGFKNYATAYSAAGVSAVATVKNANIGDVIDTAITQAEVANQRGLNTVWMNPKDFRLFKSTKDNYGQYLFIKDVNGTYTINGLNIVRTNAVTVDTMTLADASKIQLWWKRRPEIKFSQMNASDFVNDMYTIVLFMRLQCVLEAQDVTAVIHVSGIAAAITELNVV